jgi:hypothetical protein
VVPASLHGFFAASSGVAGGLIGLLFVAISVSADRLASEGAHSQPHRIRASAALTAFTNALAVSLFGLLPGDNIGWTSVVVAIVGLIFIAATLVSLVRLRQANLRTARDLLFLVGLCVIFIVQLTRGWAVVRDPADSGAVDSIAFEVVFCFLIGISRSWELIGGPDIALTRGNPARPPARARWEGRGLPRAAGRRRREHPAAPELTRSGQISPCSCRKARNSSIACS